MSNKVIIFVGQTDKVIGHHLCSQRPSEKKIQKLQLYSIPANRPDLIGIVPIFEFENLKNRNIPIFKREKRLGLLLKFGTGLLKIGLDSSV